MELNREKAVNKITKVLKRNGVIISDNDSRINLDSLGFLNLILDIEEEFEIELDDSFIERISNGTKNEIVNALLQQSKYDEKINSSV